MSKTSLLILLVLWAFISCSSGKVYNQCKLKSSKTKQTKIFTTPTDTPITDVKWLPRWDPGIFNLLDRWDMVLAATYDRIYLLQMDEVAERSAPKKLKQQETLRFTSDPNETNSMLGFCPKNEFGRIRFNRTVTPPFSFVQKPEDAQLEVCGSNCGKPVCRFYIRDMFDSRKGEDSQFLSEVKYRSSEYVLNPRHEGWQWLESEKIGGNATFVAMQGWKHKSDIFYKDVGGKDLERRYTDTQKKTFAKERRADFKKIVDREGSGKVLLFFNELMEFDPATGESVPTTTAKVAQVCKNDDSKNFHSYLALPLHCSIGEGENEMRFKKLVSVSDAVTVKTSPGVFEDVVFATMAVTHSRLNRTGSVVTMIKLSDVEDYFDNGDFMKQDFVGSKKNYHVTHGWESKKYNLEPLRLKANRPGNCQEFASAKEKREFVSKVNSFFNKNPQARNMYGSLKTSEPLYQASEGETYTSIAAYRKNHGAEVIVGSSKGNILRINVLTDELKAVAHEEVELPLKGCRKNWSCRVENLKKVPPGPHPTHIVATSGNKLFFHDVSPCKWSLLWSRDDCEKHFGCYWEEAPEALGRSCKSVTDVRRIYEKSVDNEIQLCS